jgi:hypothetical protein
MRALLLFILCFTVRGLAANDEGIELRPADAAKHGIKIELSTLNPGVIQVVVEFAKMPKEVGLVVQDSKDKFVASVPLLPRGQSCVVILDEEHVSHSYIAFPYIAQPDEKAYRLYLRDQR